MGFEEIMARDNVTSIYTSGRKCNFQNKGCDGPHLQPINVNGWFWAGAGNGRIPPTNAPNPDSAWSRTGETGIPQPDNHEGIKEGPIEAENNIGITSSTSGSPTATSEAASSATSAPASAALQKPLHLHILQLPAAILLATNLNLNDSPASSLMLCDISYVSNN